MRPYGLEHSLIPWPDVADLRAQARKGRVGHLATKSGEYRGHYRNTAAKRATRVAIKRGARAAGRDVIRAALRDA